MYWLVHFWDDDDAHDTKFRFYKAFPKRTWAEDFLRKRGNERRWRIIPPELHDEYVKLIHFPRTFEVEK